MAINELERSQLFARKRKLAIAKKTQKVKPCLSFTKSMAHFHAISQRNKNWKKEKFNSSSNHRSERKDGCTFFNPSLNLSFSLYKSVEKSKQLPSKNHDFEKASVRCFKNLPLALAHEIINILNARRSTKAKPTSFPQKPQHLRPGETEQRLVTKKYRIVKKIGHGANAEVKEAVNLQTDERVALKLISNTLSRRKAERFWNEIEAMKSVSHPSILQLKDYHTDLFDLNTTGKLCNHYILSMELCKNGDLFDLISKSGSLKEDISKRYTFQLLSGLEALHSKGICHRDIKLENLLLDEQFNLKIADFGYSSISEAFKVRKCYTQCGTGKYMAPEVLSSNCRPYDGSKYDVWSSGVVCFILIMGHPPFEIANHTDWWFQTIANFRYEVFWDEHLLKGQTKSISWDARKFLNRIFVTDPFYRASAKELLVDPWLQSNTKSFFGDDEAFSLEIENRLQSDASSV
mmetsp:Transcript_4337/g.5980  ORF Transcript_4337/g.5980 Transcript_4337/m.5980 type:complete len:461 (+) Transcript_4337:63-1445(+)